MSGDRKAEKSNIGIAAPPAKKRRLPGILIRAVILLAVLGAALFVVLNYEQISVRGLLAVINSYGNDEPEIASDYKFTANSLNTFTPHRGGLAVLSSTGLSVLDSTGSETMGTAVSFSRPVVRSAGEYLLAYDVGGVNIIYSEGTQIKMSSAYQSNIISCDINANGWYLIISEERGWKGTAKLYDTSMSEVFKWESSSSYLTCGAVSPDSKRIAIGGVRQTGARIRSSVTMLDRSKTEPYAVYECNDDLILDVRYVGDGLVIITESRIVFCDGEGTQTGEFAYGDLYLDEYALLDGGGALLKLVNNSIGSSMARLVAVDSAGIKQGELYMDSVKCVSANGPRIAILTTDRAMLYNNVLEFDKEFEIPGGGRKIFVRDDISVMVITADSARIYVD